MYSNLKRGNLDYIIKLFIAFLIIISELAVFSQNRNLEGFCISANDMQLFERVNELRVDYDKSKLQLSASLSYVAKMHVLDLSKNRPDTSICGLSSWSDKGNWKACCYNTYVLNEDCMWDKPKELTSYPYRGYELVTYFEDDFTNDSILQIWSGTREVLDMILTQGNYSTKKWVCMGVGIYKNYVSLWFGQRADQARQPKICDSTNYQPPVAKDSSSTVEGVFYLVYGSFEDINDAREALRRVKKSNFPDADILTRDGLNRIYLGKYDHLKAAIYAKQNLPYSYKEAWILKD